MRIARIRRSVLRHNRRFCESDRVHTAASSTYVFVGDGDALLYHTFEPISVLVVRVRQSLLLVVGLNFRLHDGVAGFRTSGGGAWNGEGASFINSKRLLIGHLSPATTAGLSGQSRLSTVSRGRSAVNGATNCQSVRLAEVTRAE